MFFALKLCFLLKIGFLTFISNENIGLFIVYLLWKKTYWNLEKFQGEKKKISQMIVFILTVKNYEKIKLYSKSLVKKIFSHLF